MAKLPGKSLPWCPRSQDPEDAIQDPTVVHPWDTAWLVRQPRPDRSPIMVAEFIAHHSMLHFGGLNHGVPCAQLRRTRCSTSSAERWRDLRPCTLMIVQNEHWYGQPRPASKLVLSPGVRATYLPHTSSEGTSRAYPAFPEGPSKVVDGRELALSRVTQHHVAGPRPLRQTWRCPSQTIILRDAAAGGRPCAALSSPVIFHIGTSQFCEVTSWCPSS
jgi:hypothetical protein